MYGIFFTVATPECDHPQILDTFTSTGAFATKQLAFEFAQAATEEVGKASYGSRIVTYQIIEQDPNS